MCSGRRSPPRRRARDPRRQGRVHPHVAGAVRVGALRGVGWRERTEQAQMGDGRARSLRRRRLRAGPHRPHPKVARRVAAQAGRPWARRALSDRHRHGDDVPQRHRTEGEIQGASEARAGQDGRNRRAPRVEQRGAGGPPQPRPRPRPRGRGLDGARLRTSQFPRGLRRGAQALCGRRRGQKAREPAEAGQQRRPGPRDRGDGALRRHEEGRKSAREDRARAPRASDGPARLPVRRLRGLPRPPPLDDPPGAAACVGRGRRSGPTHAALPGGRGPDPRRTSTTTRSSSRRTR